MDKKQRNKLGEALEIIEEVIEQEQEKLDNMYDNFSETERYQQMEEKKDDLDNIKCDLEEVINNG